MGEMAKATTLKWQEVSILPAFLWQMTYHSGHSGRAYFNAGNTYWASIFQQSPEFSVKGENDTRTIKAKYRGGLELAWTGAQVSNVNIFRNFASWLLNTVTLEIGSGRRDYTMSYKTSMTNQGF